MNEQAANTVRISAAGQLSITKPNKALLEILPYHFKFSYRCGDSKCKGHTQSIVDWEIGEFFRRARLAGASVREAGDFTRERWLNVVCGPARDPLFFVGNTHKRPGTSWYSACSGRQGSSRKNS